MFPTKLLTFLLKLTGTSCLFAQAQTNLSCNPLRATCPANPGLATSSYFVDFTQQRFLPANWTLAEFEHVTYGANGAEFTFAKRLDAPYIWTNFYILFGRVEVSMQAAPGIGIISSAVLMSDDLDEIDWEFSGNNFNQGSGKAQTNYFGKGIIGSYDRGTYPDVSSPQTQFHNYIFDWSPTNLTWSIDGLVVRTLTNSDANSGSYQYPQSPMKLQIGLWDGGDASNAGGTVEWAGGYTNLSQVPFTMFVKSVEITNANPCFGGYQYTDETGSYRSIKCVGTEISNSNSTLVSRPDGPNPAGCAAISSFYSTSSKPPSTANSSCVALTTAMQSPALVVSVQTSPNSTASLSPSPTGSTVMSTLSMGFMNSSLGKVSVISTFSNINTTTTPTNDSVGLASQVSVSSLAQLLFTVSSSEATFSTTPTLSPPLPMSSNSFANSNSSAITSPTDLEAASGITPPKISARTSAKIPPTGSATISPAIFTGGANRLLPRRCRMFFR